MEVPEPARVEAHPFDAAIALSPRAEGSWRALSGRTSDDYWNAVGPFGGITAAVLLNAVTVQPDRLPVPLALTVSYAGAIRAGAFEIDVRCLRGGKTTQHWFVELVQGPGRELMASAQVVFGLRRDTWGMPEAVAPAVAPPPPFGARAQGGLRWIERYRELTVKGRLFEANPDSETLSWIADHPARALDYPALAAICDVFFPRLFLRRPTVAPVATVTLNVYFHAGEALMRAQGTEPLLAQARGQVFNEGFHDQEGRVWGREGRLLATTHQVVWYKA